MPPMPGDYFVQQDFAAVDHEYWPTRVTPGLSSIMAGKQEQQNDRKVSVHDG